jgi:class 3 adenylate cyclase/tetratricopeptide (TPR) repeat protein
LPFCAHCGFRNEPHANFCGGCGRELSNHRRPPERRQMTVLFCDLVNSTALASSLDPEDLRDLIQAYQAATAVVIARHNGFVARWVGDGILAYFGYPAAHEDATAQAVRAGLGLVTTVRSMEAKKGEQLNARVGIATGIVVVGDVVEGGTLLEAASVSGAAANLAARLEALAEPGTVAIADSTRKLLRDQFDLAELGNHHLKGFGDPVAVWRVERERSIEGRRTEDGLSEDTGRLVGREQPLVQLQEWWQRATAGSGQVVIVRGEPGIGKSRLVRTLRDTVITPQSNVWHYYCAPHFQNSALFPIIDHFQRVAGFELGDTAEAKVAKLESFLKHLDPDSDLSIILPCIADLLSLPVDGRYRLSPGSPEQQLERLLDVLVGLTVSVAKTRPSMIVFEDAQWMDATSLTLIQRFIAQIENLPVLVLLTARPEFEPPWKEAQTLELGRLDKSSSTQVVQEIAGNAALPPDLMKQIMEKSDGIPLFLEEITKAVLETRLAHAGREQMLATESPASLSVPSSLQDSLMSRLDRLEDVKDVVQMGAAIGRRFTFALLADASKTPVTELRAALRRLVDADLISCQGQGSEMTCMFKHALVRDAAYATLLRPNRRALHRRIAEALGQDSRRRVSTEPELLAYHMTEADLPLQAIPLWQEAGTRAASRAAHLEATNHFGAALALLEQASLDDRLQRELMLRTQLALSLSASRGYAAPEVQSAYARAREICTTLGNQAEHFPVLRGLCTFYIVRDELSTARNLAQQCFRIGEETQRPEYLIEGCTALGYVLVFMGELADGRSLLERAIQIYKSNNGQTLVFQTAQDPCVACLGLLALVSWAQGAFEQAAAYREESLATATRLNRPFDMAYAGCFAAMLDNIRSEPRTAAELATTAAQISRDHGFGIWLVAGSMHLAIANGLLGDTSGAIDSLTGLLETWRIGGAELNRPFFLASLAEFSGAKGRVDEALVTIETAIDHAHRNGEHFYTALLHRIRGDLLRRKGDSVAARAAFKTALDLARQQGAKGYELLILRSVCEFSGDGSGKDQSVAALQILSHELSGSGVHPSISVSRDEMPGA